MGYLKKQMYWCIIYYMKGESDVQSQFALSGIVLENSI